MYICIKNVIYTTHIYTNPNIIFKNKLINNFFLSFFKTQSYFLFPFKRCQSISEMYACMQVSIMKTQVYFTHQNYFKLKNHEPTRECRSEPTCECRRGYLTSFKIPSLGLLIYSISVVFFY